MTAINYAARKLGITRKDNATSAKKKLPDIQLPHVQVILSDGTKMEGSHDLKLRANSKVTLSRYREESYKVLSVYRRFVPLVERASIDEAYLDLTSLVDTALNKYQKSIHSSTPNTAGTASASASSSSSSSSATSS